MYGQIQTYLSACLDKNASYVRSQEALLSDQTTEMRA